MLLLQEEKELSDTMMLDQSATGNSHLSVTVTTLLFCSNVTLCKQSVRPAAFVAILLINLFIALPMTTAAAIFCCHIAGCPAERTEDHQLVFYHTLIKTSFIHSFISLDLVCSLVGLSISSITHKV